MSRGVWFVLLAAVAAGCGGSESAVGSAGFAFLEEAPDAEWEGPIALARLGASVAGLGDVNADGYEDLAVVQEWFSDGESGEGLVEVFLGGAGGPSATADWSWQPDQISAGDGLRVAAAGDVDGDGFADLLVGVPDWAGVAGAATGRALLFRGGRWRAHERARLVHRGGGSRRVTGCGAVRDRGHRWRWARRRPDRSPRLERRNVRPGAGALRRRRGRRPVCRRRRERGGRQPGCGPGLVGGGAVRRRRRRLRGRRRGGAGRAGRRDRPG